MIIPRWARIIVVYKLLCWCESDDALDRLFFSVNRDDEVSFVYCVILLIKGQLSATGSVRLSYYLQEMRRTEKSQKRTALVVPVILQHQHLINSQRPSRQKYTQTHTHDRTYKRSIVTYGDDFLNSTCHGRKWPLASAFRLARYTSVYIAIQSKHKRIKIRKEEYRDHSSCFPRWRVSQQT